MRIKITILFLIIIIGAKALPAYAECATNIPSFEKLSYDAASEAASAELSAIIETKEKTICADYYTNLANEIQLPKLDDDKRVLAIWLLGSLRPHDSNSIEVLIKYIDLKATKIDPRFRLARWGEYPAQEALITIGTTAVTKPLLEHLTYESKLIRRQLMCKALGLLEGKKTVRNKIKQMLVDEKDSTKRANLTAALKELEK